MNYGVGAVVLVVLVGSDGRSTEINTDCRDSRVVYTQESKV